MKLEEHEMISRELFGKPFTELHQEMDKYAAQYIGYCHRRVFHHLLGVEYLVELFQSEEVREVAKQHVRDDGMIKCEKTGELYSHWDDGYEWVFFKGEEEREKQNKILVTLYPRYVNLIN